MPHVAVLNRQPTRSPQWYTRYSSIFRYCCRAATATRNRNSVYAVYGNCKEIILLVLNKELKNISSVFEPTSVDSYVFGMGRSGSRMIQLHPSWLNFKHEAYEVHDQFDIWLNILSGHDNYFKKNIIEGPAGNSKNKCPCNGRLLRHNVYNCIKCFNAI